MFIKNADFYPYSRVGVTLGLPFGMTTTTKLESVVNQPVNSEILWAYKLGAAVGYMTALGVRKSLSPGFKLFAEIQANNLIVQPKSASVISYMFNGEDALSKLATAQKEIIYTDNPNPNSTIESAKTVFSLSRVCLQFGFTFRF